MSSTSTRPRVAVVLLVAALASLATGLAGEGRAEAAPTAAEKSEAKAAWEKGKQAVTRKKWSAAVDAFRDADALDPKLQYKLDLARALVEQKKYREASDVLDEIDASKEKGNAGARGEANKLRVKAEKRLATIVLEIQGPKSGATADVDGEKVEAGDAIRLDPGKHLVRARADGFVPIERSLDLKEGQTEAVELKMDRDPNAVSDEEEEPEEEEPPKDPDGAEGDGTLLPAAIAWGTGGAAIVLGSVFGALAFSEAEKAREGCVDNVCPESSVEALDASRDSGTASTICFVIGGVGIVTGVVLAFAFGSSSDPAAAPEEASVQPWLGANELGVQGTF